MAGPAEGLLSWLVGPFSRLGLRTALVTFLVDQSHKLWMLGIYRIQDRGRVRITPFLDLVHVINPGISYGWFAQDGRSGQIFLATFALVAVVGLALWLARGATSNLMAVSIGLIMGGAIANGLDRLHLGGVADFFSLHAFGFYWYVFNIADVAIVAGVVGLVYESLWSSRKDATNGA
jgi:signal peptidase II